MTKPRPDQPGRWRKGSPRIESDRERADRLQEDVEEYDATLTRQRDLLTRTVNALRGDPPPLTSWSHHDIPELAAEKVAEVERLTAERDAAIERLERVIDQWRKTGRAVISEMNRADNAEAERDALAAAHARESEKVWKVEEVMDDIEGSDPTTWERLRATLAEPETDTTDTQTTDQELSDQ